MRKIIAFYSLYLVGIWIYFAFLYPLDTFGSTRYAAYSHAMFFSKLPLPLLFLYLVISKGYSTCWADYAARVAKREWVRTALFCALLAGIYHLIEIPFNLVWYQIAQWAGTSHQPFGDWLYEQSVSLLLYWTALSIGVFAARLLIGRFNQYWWLFVWSAALPAALFFVYIQPVWIDPLYEEYAPIDPGPLYEAIERMADQSGLEDAPLLQVNMSEKTNNFNAYVSGLWGSERIVLWDTTLEGMEEEEVLFILAHEIGHYVYRHVPLGVAGYLCMSLVLLWLASLIYKRVWERLAKHPAWQKPDELKAVPVLLLTISVLLTVFQPVSLAVSRQIELAADDYAIEHTEDLTAGVNAFTRMAEQSKTDIRPLIWIKWIRYSHPPIQERIDRIKAEMQETP